MPRGSSLTEFEKGRITALSSQEMSFRQIGRKIGRSDRVVRNYLKDVEAYGKAKSSGRPSVVLRAINAILSTLRLIRQLVPRK